MAEEPIQVELTILGRSFGLTCAPGFESTLRRAASKLDEDLRADFGESKVSAKNMLDHLVAVTLEYICEAFNDDADEEKREATRRIEALISTVDELKSELAEPKQVGS